MDLRATVLSEGHRHYFLIQTQGLVVFYQEQHCVRLRMPLVVMHYSLNYLDLWVVCVQVHLQTSLSFEYQAQLHM